MYKQIGRIRHNETDSTGSRSGSTTLPLTLYSLHAVPQLWIRRRCQRASPGERGASRSCSRNVRGAAGGSSPRCQATATKPNQIMLAIYLNFFNSSKYWSWTFPAIFIGIEVVFDITKSFYGALKQLSF